MAPSESLKDKTDPISVEANRSATDKSPDDLEVDNILSHSKVEHPSAEQRANLIVSEYHCILNALTTRHLKCFTILTIRLSKADADFIWFCVARGTQCIISHRIQ